MIWRGSDLVSFYFAYKLNTVCFDDKLKICDLQARWSRVPFWQHDSNIYSEGYADERSDYKEHSTSSFLWSALDLIFTSFKRTVSYRSHSPYISVSVVRLSVLCYHFVDAYVGHIQPLLIFIAMCWNFFYIPLFFNVCFILVVNFFMLVHIILWTAGQNV